MAYPAQLSCWILTEWGREAGENDFRPAAVSISFADGNLQQAPGRQVALKSEGQANAFFFGGCVGQYDQRSHIAPAAALDH